MQFDLYKYIGKVSYDSGWDIQPEHDKDHGDKRFGLQRLPEALQMVNGETVPVRCRVEDLRRLHTELRSEPPALATIREWDAAKDGLPIQVLMGTSTKTRNNTHRMVTRFREFPSDRVFHVDVKVALTLLNIYPNNMVWELANESLEVDDNFDDEIPKPKTLSKKTKRTKKEIN